MFAAFIFSFIGKKGKKDFINCWYIYFVQKDLGCPPNITLSYYLRQNCPVSQKATYKISVVIRSCKNYLLYEMFFFTKYFNNPYRIEDYDRCEKCIGTWAPSNQ